ncbi:restriction endonuclease [Actinobacillus equuli]|uniref:restriction endonuclease n=1 Tax=Actinobacillus equuli TaxID=718 RepID=UPI0024422915|nr:restriction endonuclease [Actinobacillus equuli]WGE49347.1 restriction endonuclease [Actinobacillus equuli subsp. equuli]
MEKISFGRDFERIVVELFQKIFGVEHVTTEIPLIYDNHEYIADMIIDNKFLVEIKFYRSKVPLYVLENIASKLSCFLDVANCVEGIIIISNDISKQYKDKLQKKYPKITVIDVTKLIHFSEHFLDIKYKLYSYQGASQG